MCLLLFTCNYVVSVWRGFLFLWVLGMGYVILLWHFLSLSFIIFQFQDGSVFGSTDLFEFCKITLFPSDL